MFRLSDTIRRTETPDGGILLEILRNRNFDLARVERALVVYGL